MTEGQSESVQAAVSWMAFLIFIMVGKVSEWVPGLSSIPLAKIAFVLAVISAWRSRRGWSSVRLGSIRIARPAFAFLVLAVLSVGFSIYKTATLKESEVVLILLLSMMVLLKVTRSLRDVERLLVGIAAASVSLSLGLILNYHGGRADINANFDPNEIAYVLDSALPIVLALALALGSKDSRKTWWLLIGLSMVIVVSVLLTGSRGGLIGLCVVGSLLLMFPLSRDGRGLLRSFSPKYALIGALVMIAVLGLGWGMLPSTARARAASLLNLGSDYNASSTLNSSRLVIWNRDLSAALARPIGYGLGTAETVDGRSGGQYRTAHNSLVEVAVELGALGLSLYIYVFYVTLKYLGRITAAARRASSGDILWRVAPYARALSISLVGNMTAGFFLSQAYSAVFWMEVAISAALVRIALPSRRLSAKAATQQIHKIHARRVY